MSDRTATLSFNDGSSPVTFPILSGTVGPDVIDIRTLYGKTGKFTYDPGYLSTAACTSQITYIDGDKGELLYRGYPIEQLAEDSNYLETAYLILFGELPTTAQLQNWTREITLHTMLHENIKKFMEGFRYSAHPMSMFVSTIAALSSVYPDAKLVHSSVDRMHQIVRLEKPLE